MLLEFEKTKPLTVKIRNLINHASPVATTPKYNKDNVEANDGFEFHGISKISEKGSKKITDQIVVEVVTFSFLLFFNFSVINPPIQ